MTCMSQSDSFLFLIHALSPGRVAKITRRVLLVDHDLLILSEHLSSLPDFQWDTCCSIFSFLCIFCRLLCALFLVVIIILYVLLWCTSMITPVISFCVLTIIFRFRFCRSLFVLLYFFFWPLCCLYFLDIRILIATLVSSNSSWNCPHQFILSIYFGWNKNFL